MSTTNDITTLTGHEAIDYADAHGLTLSKYADPTEGARDGLTIDEAREIAKEDPSLVYVEVVPEEVRVSRLRSAVDAFTAKYRHLAAKPSDEDGGAL